MSTIGDNEAATVPLWQPSVVRTAMDVKGTMLKWEPVCVPFDGRIGSLGRATSDVELQGGNGVINV